MECGGQSEAVAALFVAWPQCYKVLQGKAVSPLRSAIALQIIGGVWGICVY